MGNASMFFRNMKNSIIDNGPAILTGVGVVGMVITTVIAVKATPKAIKHIEEAKKEAGVEKLTPVETIKATWKCYIPAVATGVTSTACLVGANSVNARRSAALMTAYNVTQTVLTEYKDKVVETIGEKKEQVIRDSIAKDKLDKDPVSINEVVMTNHGSTLIYDGAYGRYFYSDIESIRKAINTINRRIVSGAVYYASLNEFYDELGLKPIEVGEYVGWNIDDGEIEIDISAQVADDEKTPCIVIHYSKLPKYEYWKTI